MNQIEGPYLNNKSFYLTVDEDFNYSRWGAEILWSGIVNGQKGSFYLTK
jgi:hypothetical protein